MARQLTEDDVRQSITDHAIEKGIAFRNRYGPISGIDELIAALGDREFVRYPCRIDYDDSALRSGEFALPVQQGDHPDDGFVLMVHPLLKRWPEWVVYVILYHLVTVNYGKFATARDAEAFGAAALGIAVEVYYQRLCVLQDALIEAENSGFLLVQEPELIVSTV